MKKIRKFIKDKYRRRQGVDGEVEEEVEGPSFAVIEKHLFRVDAENIEKKVFCYQRRELIRNMGECLLHFVISIIGNQIVFSIGFNTHWMLGLCLVGTFCYGSKVANIFKFCAAFVSFAAPKLLLDEHRQRDVHRKHKYLSYFDIPIILIVFYCFDELGQESLLRDQLKVELSRFVMIAFLANIYLALALVIGMVYLCLVCLIAPIYLIQVVLGVCFQGLFILRKRRSAVERIDRLDKTTWKQNQQQKNGLKCSVTECMICMTDFEDDSELVQLQCHKDHTFHFDCFKSFLTSQSDAKILKPSCPLCRQPIKFQNDWNWKTLIRIHLGVRI